MYECGGCDGEGEGDEDGEWECGSVAGEYECMSVMVMDCVSV